MVATLLENSPAEGPDQLVGGPSRSCFNLCSGFSSWMSRQEIMWVALARGHLWVWSHQIPKSRCGTKPAWKCDVFAAAGSFQCVLVWRCCGPDGDQILTDHQAVDFITYLLSCSLWNLKLTSTSASLRVSSRFRSRLLFIRVPQVGARSGATSQ